MNLDTEFIAHDGPLMLRAYLLKEAVFQDLMQLKAKVSYIFVPILFRKFCVHSNCA
jgi:hypothetical protein